MGEFCISLFNFCTTRKEYISDHWKNLDPMVFLIFKVCTTLTIGDEVLCLLASPNMALRRVS